MKILSKKEVKEQIDQKKRLIEYLIVSIVFSLICLFAMHWIQGNYNPDFLKDWNYAQTRFSIMVFFMPMAGIVMFFTHTELKELKKKFDRAS